MSLYTKNFTPCLNSWTPLTFINKLCLRAYTWSMIMNYLNNWEKECVWGSNCYILYNHRVLHFSQPMTFLTVISYQPLVKSHYIESNKETNQRVSFHTAVTRISTEEVEEHLYHFIHHYQKRELYLHVWLWRYYLCVIN